MRIYLDVSCLNRPFDDMSQLRVKMEAEAVKYIADNHNLYGWKCVSSEMAVKEVDAIPDEYRRTQVKLYLPDEESIIPLDDDILDRAEEVALLGFREGDAVHIAASEALEVDILLTCDDKMIKVGRRHRSKLKVTLANPHTWLGEMIDERIQ
jgi:hypothetical protein